MFKLQRGQGMLETIIAIAVFITGAIATVALIIASVNAGRQSQQNIIANNLASEAVEAIRQIRDSNYLAPCDPTVCWSNGLISNPAGDTTAILALNPTTAGLPWSLDFNVVSINDAQARMYLNNGVYSQAVIIPPGQATTFYRLVTVDPNGTNHMLNVKVQVLWQEKGGPKSVFQETKLYNWRAPQP